MQSQIQKLQNKIKMIYEFEKTESGYIVCGKEFNDGIGNINFKNALAYFFGLFQDSQKQHIKSMRIVGSRAVEMVFEHDGNYPEMSNIDNIIQFLEGIGFKVTPNKTTT